MALIPIYHGGDRPARTDGAWNAQGYRLMDPVSAEENYRRYAEEWTRTVYEPVYCLDLCDCSLQEAIGVAKGGEATFEVGDIFETHAIAKGSEILGLRAMLRDAEGWTLNVNVINTLDDSVVAGPLALVNEGYVSFAGAAPWTTAVENLAVQVVIAALPAEFDGTPCGSCDSVCPSISLAPVVLKPLLHCGGDMVDITVAEAADLVAA